VRRTPGGSLVSARVERGAGPSAPGTAGVSLDAGWDLIQRMLAQQEADRGVAVTPILDAPILDDEAEDG
jgi:hypothetical protein